jgi:hypothetical protein
MLDSRRNIALARTLSALAGYIDLETGLPDVNK